MTGNNIGGANNTVLTKASGSAISQKITEIGPEYHQTMDEVLSSKARDPAPRATII